MNVVLLPKALGSPAVVSSGPSTAVERVTFSSVARLGFAAGHDSQDSGATGNLPTMSLASSFRKRVSNILVTLYLRNVQL